MKIDRLVLTNFRNHENFTVDFDGKSCLIVGDNGLGKTNILEAVHLLSTTKSLRTEFDKEMISHDKNFARIELTAFPNGDKTLLEMVITKSDRFENSSSKKVKIDKVAKSLNTFAGTINTVLFTPHDVEIFTSTPSVRRKHLDSLFFQIDRTYKKATSEYTKAIKQRNKLLEMMRDFGTGSDQIEFWTTKAVESGKIIQDKRERFFDFARENTQKHGKKLNRDDVTYEINYDKSEISAERLNKYKDAEIASCKTLVGPHRDDFSINFNGYDVARYGSRGQKRSTVLALKLCEIDFIDKAVGKRPILLLDDIFSELDQTHKDAVLNIIGMQQTIITSAEKENNDMGLKTVEI
ncbi:DNA replication and repair protein RecF [candidate division WWE3 bacterium]|nr:DNA replication and repair protein RecF [candidate division WWE3 bacterium]